MTRAVAAPPLPASPVRRFSREDIVRLGQEGKPWEFVPVGYQAVGLAPEDWGIRVLLAANLARLGLRTLAVEQLAAMPAQVRGDEMVRGLDAAIAALKDDRITRAELEGTARANVEALAAAGPDLRRDLAAWGGSAWDWFRAGDGNIVRRRGASLLGLSDQRGAAAAFGREHLGKRDQPPIFSIEGVDPPWLLIEVAARTGRGKDGFWPLLAVVQADAAEFLDGLAQADLRGVLTQQRVRAFVGPEASMRLREELRARLGSRMVGAYIPQLSVRTRATPGVARVLEQAEAEQLAEHERLAGDVARIYAGRDRAWWGRRFGEARGGSGTRSTDGRPPVASPLRVLVASCRYTTYVQHAAADLVGALRMLGHEAELLIEPDDSWRFSTVAYLRAVARFKPDLMVVVNYPRRQIGDWLPPNLPFVCWIQDAMPHLFDAAAGAAQGEFDYLAGHVFEELHTRFGYPRGRGLMSPVVASTAKFHTGAVDAGLHREHECEIAMVSHHSEPPEAMHERLVDEAGRGAPIQRVLEELRPLVWELATEPMAGPVHWRLERASREAIRRHLSCEPDGKALTLVHKNYCLPLADRVLRHRTLAWAADLARERGWRLHIYGRGWEGHAAFGAYARGELPHGEPLRASYQSATVHLHASINTLAHQRVMECALSGGLPLCRLFFDAVRPMEVAAIWAAMRSGEPTVGDPRSRQHGYFPIDVPEAAAWVGLRQRMGWGGEAGLFWVHEKFLAARARGAGEPAWEPEAAWLLGDFGEMTFTSKERLGELVELAISGPGWRAGWSGLIASRVRERFTHERFAQRVIGLVKGSLEG